MPWRLVLISALLLCSCSSSPSVDPVDTTDPVGTVPGDFSLDLTLLVADPSPRVERMQSRYVLFADGSLHYAAEPGRGPRTLPPLIRRLDHHQVARLWEQLQATGLADPAAGDAVINFSLVPQPVVGSTWLTAITADAQYWNFVRGAGRGQDPDQAFVDLVRHLGALVWASDLPDELVFVEPFRYDFGPDPYMAYRQQAVLIEAAEADAAAAAADDSGDASADDDLEESTPDGEVDE